MQASPLQLEGYFLKDLQFSLTDSLGDMQDKAIKYGNPGISVDVKTDRRGNDPRKWRCELSVESNKDSDLKLPYTFRITFVGFFEVIKGYPEERIELMARTNAPALLYSAAREALLPLTARGPVPALILPSVTFLQPATEAGSQAREGTKTPTKKKQVVRKAPGK